MEDIESTELRNSIEKLACNAIKCVAGEFDPVEEFSIIIRLVNQNHKRHGECIDHLTSSQSPQL